MKLRYRFAYPVLAAALLAACADQTLPTTQPGPLSQQDASEVATDLVNELTAILEQASKDEGLVALKGFPHDGAMTNPFFGYAISLMRAEHPDRLPRTLQALAAADLPRGVYRHTQDNASVGWRFQEASDDLILIWPYDSNPATPEVKAAEASATFDWDALRPTAEVETPTGEILEVPVQASLSMIANGETVANVNAALTYYQSPSCGSSVDGILEPTSLIVEGTGSLLSLENVGYTVTETEAGDSVATQGLVTLADSGVTFDWAVSVAGELVREDCYLQDFTPTEGTVAATLSGLPGATRSLAVDFNFAGFEPAAETVTQITGGSLIINGDQRRQVTFAGPLGDQDADGVPGDELTVSFADGNTTTLEQLLTDLYGSVRTFRQLR